MGYRSLSLNTTGTTNTAVGMQSLYVNTTGNHNTALGYNSLRLNTTGANNVALGNQALDANTTASNNTAVGDRALYSNTTGSLSTCVGQGAGYSTTTGYGNTFIGYAAGHLNTTGINNTFIGGRNGSGHTSGYNMTTGSDNVIIGCFNGNHGGLDIRTSNAHIVLSNGYGTPHLWINGTGELFVQQVYTSTTGTSANVAVTSDGMIRRSTSSLRYKNTVNDATHGLTELLALRSVTYKGNNDGDTVFGGLIAEEVHDAGLTEFVQYDDDNQPDALAYGNMVSLCIKAIQELSTKNDALEARIATLEG